MQDLSLLNLVGSRPVLFVTLFPAKLSTADVLGMASRMGMRRRILILKELPAGPGSKKKFDFRVEGGVATHAFFIESTGTISMGTSSPGAVFSVVTNSHGS